MKAKAVTDKRRSPRKFRRALNYLRRILEVKVLFECFGIEVGSMTAAEFYVQETDYTHGHDAFVNYNFSGITIKEGRDFEKATQVIVDIITELVKRHWKSGETVTLFVVIHASNAEGTVSKLIESDLVKIETEKQGGLLQRFLEWAGWA